MDFLDCMMIQEMKARIREERDREQILKAQFKILMEEAPEGF